MNSGYRPIEGGSPVGHLGDNMPTGDYSVSLQVPFTPFTSNNIASASDYASCTYSKRYHFANNTSYDLRLSPCPNNQPLVLSCSDGYRYNPQTLSCVPKVITSPVSTPSVPQYIITGNVKGTSGLLTGAKVELVHKPGFVGYTTAITGGSYEGKNYLSNKFGANSFDDAYLKFSAIGYQPLELKLLDAGVMNTTLVARGDEVYELKTIRDVTLVGATGKMDIQGMVKDSRGNLIPNIQIKTYCPSYPQGMYAPCLSKYPGGLPSSSTTLQPRTTHNNSENYFIFNLYDFANDTNFDYMSIGVTPPTGYFVDQDLDGEQDKEEDSGREAYFDINRTDIKSDGTVGHNTYVDVDDIKVLETKVASVTFKGTLYRVGANPARHIGLKGTINIQKPNGDWVTSVVTKDDGTYEIKFPVSALGDPPYFKVSGKHVLHESVTNRDIDFEGCWKGPSGTLTRCGMLQVPMNPMANVTSFDNIDIKIAFDAVPTPYTVLTGYV